MREAIATAIEILAIAVAALIIMCAPVVAILLLTC